MKKLLSLLFCVALALSANAQKTYAIITTVIGIIKLLCKIFGILQ